MRSAASLLGIIGGLIGIIVGLFGYGFTELSEQHAELADLFDLFENPGYIRFASFAAPLLAIAGGAMAKTRALWGGMLLLGAAVLFYTAFGFNVWTMFPIGFAGLAGVLAIAAGKPDEPMAHF